MIKLRQNHLLASVFCALLAYWVLGALIPGYVLSVGLGVFSILIGLAILIRYSRGMYGVLIMGERSPEGDGAHLAVIGIPAIAGAIVYGGLFTLSWNLAGQPSEWLATPASNFSRLLLTLGCIALYLTPDVDKQKLQLPGLVWLVTIVVSAIVTAFLLGTYVGTDRLQETLPWRPKPVPLQLDPSGITQDAGPALKPLIPPT